MKQRHPEKILKGGIINIKFSLTTAASLMIRAENVEVISKLPNKDSKF